MSTRQRTKMFGSENVVFFTTYLYMLLFLAIIILLHHVVNTTAYVYVLTSHITNI
jgi:hypothetical protein